MALVGTFTLFGIAVPTAYARVTSVSGGKHLGWQGQMSIYAEGKPPEVDATVVAQMPRPPALTLTVHAPYAPGEDALQSVYKAAKALPSFDQMASDAEPSAAVSRVAFLKRMTAEERTSIRAAAKSNPALDDLVWMLEAADPVHLDDPLTVYGINQLATIGLLTPERAAEILTP